MPTMMNIQYDDKAVVYRTARLALDASGDGIDDVEHVVDGTVGSEEVPLTVVDEAIQSRTVDAFDLGLPDLPHYPPAFVDELGSIWKAGEAPWKDVRKQLEECIRWMQTVQKELSAPLTMTPVLLLRNELRLPMPTESIIRDDVLLKDYVANAAKTYTSMWRPLPFIVMMPVRVERGSHAIIDLGMMNSVGDVSSVTWPLQWDDEMSPIAMRLNWKKHTGNITPDRGLLVMSSVRLVALAGQGDVPDRRQWTTNLLQGDGGFEPLRLTRHDFRRVAAELPTLVTASYIATTYEVSMRKDGGLARLWDRPLKVAAVLQAADSQGGLEGQDGDPVIMKPEI